MIMKSVDVLYTLLRERFFLDGLERLERLEDLDRLPPFEGPRKKDATGFAKR